MPPYEFIDDGVARGLNVELFNAIGASIGKSIDYRLGDWGASQKMVEEGHGDVLPPLVSTPSRREKYNFTRSLWTIDFSLFARSGDAGRVASTERSSLKIGVTGAGFARQYFNERFPSASLVTCSDTLDGVRRLNRGDIDAYAGNSLATAFFMRELGIGGIVEIGDPFTSVEVGIAVHKRNPKLHADLDGAIGRLIAGGSVESLQKKWKGSEVLLSKGQLWTLVGVGAGTTALGIAATYATMQRRKARVLEKEIEQRKETEELLERARQEANEAREAAEAGARAKTEFLANISHEIRTPMNAIVGLTRLMRRSKISDAEQGDRLMKIDAAAQHLTALVSDVLDHAKIESGKLTLDRAEFGLASLLESVQSHIAVLAEQKGLSIDVDCPSNLPAFVGDPTRLRQALINLAGNAVKFTLKGSILLRGRVVQESGARATLMLEVEDSGPGIDAETLSRLFEPFEQGDATVSRRHGGTGLGLSITRRLAELMGGKAGVESRVGWGSRFWFTAEVEIGSNGWPQAQTKNGVRASELLRRKHRGARVLLAEDNQVNMEVARALLEEVGLVVVCVKNGREAVDAFGEERFDAVLMDMQMPEMDGMQATLEIRSRWPDRQIPIIALTANAFDEDRRACLMAGMNGFATKPLDTDLLYELLLKWIGNEAGQGQDEGTGGGSSQMGFLVDEVRPRRGIAARPDADGMEALRSVKGLDVDTAMRRMTIKRELYLKMLEVLGAEAGEVTRQVCESIERGDSAAAIRLAHRLRGSAGELGAHALAARLLDIELLLKGGGAEADLLIVKGRKLRAEGELLSEDLKSALAMVGVVR